MLGFSITDRWSKMENQSVVQQVLSHLVNNPFSSFKKMELNLDSNWDNIPDIGKAVGTILGGTSRTVSFGTREPYYLKMSFAKDKIQNAIVGSIDENYLVGKNVEVLTAYLRTLSQDFPSFYNAGINPIPDISDFYERNGIDDVPAYCFNQFVSWWHLISPIAYRENFTREVMLGIPAWRVVEHNNGCIEIQTWEDLTDNNQMQDKIRNVNAYLIERRLDRTKL